TLAALAGIVTLLMRLPLVMPAPAPWEVIGSALLIVLSAYVLMRWLQGYFWGLVAAAVLVAHPQFWNWAEPAHRAWRGAALDRVRLTVAVAGCLLAFRREFAWRWWLCFAALGGAAVPAAAWDMPAGTFCSRTLLAWWLLPLLTLALLPSLR